MLKSDYLNKNNDYFKYIRLDIVKLVPINPQSKILDVGAAGGYMLKYLKENGFASECYGIELFNLPNTEQDSLLIDRMIIGNIESDVIELPESYFDVVICGDVLEHLVDPWAALKKITSWMKPGGKIIISTPNIRFIKALFQIVIKGTFKYESFGVMDKMHMRFFCKSNIKELASTGCLKLDSIFSNLDLRVEKRAQFFNLISFGLFKQFLSTQYMTISTKSS